MQIHHLLPENGAVLAVAPDHVEIMFDADLVPAALLARRRRTRR